MSRFISLFAFVILLCSGVAHSQPVYIFPDLTDEALISALEQEYAVTTVLSYNAARNFMFEDFDVVDGSVVGVYTGSTHFYSGNPSRSEAQNNGFNTEHTWPQSFYDQASPMRTDIHHLYITDAGVNSARSNFKFDEIPDAQTNHWYYLGFNQTTIPTNNIDLYSELRSSTSFEPREDHKGNVARAIFYFWTVYQNNSDVTGDATNNEAFFNGMKDVLLTWHDLDPVDDAELERSLNIESVQGNRNPFIHDTTLVRRAYFGGNAIGVSNEEEREIPKSFTIEQNYPNPFNPSTTIEFSLNEPNVVKVEVFNSLGQKMTELTNQRYAAGTYTLQFDGSDLASGVYTYIFRVGEVVESRNMMLIK